MLPDGAIESGIRSRLQATLPVVLSVLLGVLLASSGHAQQSLPPQATTAGAESLQDLAKDTLNPFAGFIKVPFQFTTGFGVGAYKRVGESLNIEPLLPFALNSDWDLIARPSLNVTCAPGPNEQFGFQDLQTSFFLTPAKDKPWIWGIGPIFQFPTASSERLGTGRWSAGPTAALVYEQGPWFIGILSYQLMSFAGDRGRGSVNQTYIEPQVSYSLDSGWYGQWDPSITYDWTADTDNAWTIPVGVDIGKAFQIGERAMSLQVGGYDYPMPPDGAPKWIIRAQMTFLLTRN
ncbi:transporter [Candidatus Binatus sp.]|jgi:hypothetical protein|uniref:transporter n=1 Tax=Candidatus Binatus sp. TaxID=2811406 RepID=UPI003BC3BC87